MCTEAGEEAHDDVAAVLEHLDLLPEADVIVELLVVIESEGDGMDAHVGVGKNAILEGVIVTQGDIQRVLRLAQKVVADADETDA